MALNLKVIFPGEDVAWWIEVEQGRQVNNQQTRWIIYRDSQTDRHIK